MICGNKLWEERVRVRVCKCIFFQKMIWKDLEGLKITAVNSGWMNKRSMHSFTIHSFY